MKIWAHRGASAYAPENTLASFRKAIEMNADGIELDVHLSSDGELMVGHDEAIDRCSNGTGEIRSMTCAELKTYDYSYKFPEYKGETMPTLCEVFELIRPSRLTINVELKTNQYEYPGIEQKCIDLAEELGMTDRILYSSFNPASLERLHALNPALPTALLYEGVVPTIADRAKDSFWVAIHPEFIDMYRENAVDEIHAQGRAVNTWTVNEPEDIRRLIALGVDALITNKPDLVRKIWEEEFRSGEKA